MWKPPGEWSRSQSVTSHCLVYFSYQFLNYFSTIPVPSELYKVIKTKLRIRSSVQQWVAQTWLKMKMLNQNPLFTCVSGSCRSFCVRSPSTDLPVTKSQPPLRTISKLPLFIIQLHDFILNHRNLSGRVSTLPLLVSCSNKNNWTMMMVTLTRGEKRGG